MPSRQQSVPAEVEWLTSGRSGEADLEGEEVHVQLAGKPGCRLKGVVAGRGAASTVFVDGCFLSPSEFVRKAGWDNHQAPLTLICVTCCGLTVDKVLEGKGSATPYGKWCLKTMLQHLEEHYDVKTAEDLPRFCKERAKASGRGQLGRFAYRVCRPDQKPADLRKNGVSLPSKSASWREGHSSSASIRDYFSRLTEHIKEGSNRSRARQPFISATRDLQSAYYWGFGGVQPIVRIDLQKCLEHGILYWDMHKDHFLTIAHARNFAETSAEVVLDDDIPADCCEVLEVRWSFAAELQHSNKLNKRCRELFPKWKPTDPEFDPSTIQIVSVLEAGSSMPLKVKIPSFGDQLFVMKRGGHKGVANPAHMSSEFFAQALYGAMGANVPFSALSSIKVYAKDDKFNRCLRTNVLLMEFLVGKAFDPHEASHKRHQKDHITNLCAADIAMANFDVAGPGFNNLLYSNERVYRIDTGSALTFRPDGTPKDPAALGAGRSQVLAAKDLFAGEGGRAPAGDNFSKLAATRTNVANAAAIPAPETLSMLFKRVAGNAKKISKQARRILLSFEQNMDIWFGENERSLDAHWLTVFNLVLKRLRHLADVHPAMPAADLQASRKPADGGQNSGPAPTSGVEPAPDAAHLISQHAAPAQEPALQTRNSNHVPAPRMDIIVYSSRSAKDGKNGIDGYRKPFHDKYKMQGYKVIDVTINGPDGNWKVLSPFYPHGGIPIPTCQSHTAFSVEGIWQGLKILSDGKGIDRRRFSNKSMKGLKRQSCKRKRPEEPGASSKFPEVIGHWSGGFDAETDTTHPEPSDLFDYVQARKHIYVPAFTWVLENSPAAQHALKALANIAANQKVVLLDYYTNGDVENDSTPLSHAALIKKYVEDHAQELLS